MHSEGVRDIASVANASLTATRRPELHVLTSVRAFAALEVVFLHTLFFLGGKSVQRLPCVVLDGLTRGGLAVSFFFVLSGFILAYTYSDSDGGLRGTARKFWRARFARIYPLYFLGFVLDAPRVIAFFFGSAPSLASSLAKIGIAATAYLTLLQSWYPRLTNTWNTPGWSLSTEAFFYLVFPALVTVTKDWRLPRLFGAGIALWALPIFALTALSHAHTVDFGPPGVQTFLRSFPPLRLSEFVLGVAAGRLFLSRRLEPHLRSVRLLGIFSCALIIVLPVFSVVLPGAVVENTLGAPFFTIAIFAAASEAIPTPRWLSAPLLVLLGRASYAVYIIHVPFITIFLKLAPLAGFGSPSPGLLIAYLLSVELLCRAVLVVRGSTATLDHEVGSMTLLGNRWNHHLLREPSDRRRLVLEFVPSVWPRARGDEVHAQLSHLVRSPVRMLERIRPTFHGAAQASGRQHTRNSAYATLHR